MEFVRLNCRDPAGALVVTRPQGVKLLGAEMKRRIRRHCFSAPCANALIEAVDWEGPVYQTCAEGCSPHWLQNTSDPRKPYAETGIEPWFYEGFGHHDAHPAWNLFGLIAGTLRAL